MGRPRISDEDQVARVISDLNSLLSSYSLPTEHPKVTLYFDAANFQRKSVDQRILILENLEFPTSAVLTYKNRVLDILKLSESNIGNYERISASLTVLQNFILAGTGIFKSAGTPVFIDGERLFSPIREHPFSFERERVFSS